MIEKICKYVYGTAYYRTQIRNLHSCFWFQTTVDIQYLKYTRVVYQYSTIFSNIYYKSRYKKFLTKLRYLCTCVHSSHVDCKWKILYATYVIPRILFTTLCYAYSIVLLIYVSGNTLHSIWMRITSWFLAMNSSQQ